MSLYEQLTANFRRWEQRGRGVQLFPDPVELEPPFVPFPGHRLKLGGLSDSGLKPTLVSRLTDKVFRALQPPKQAGLTVPTSADEEPLPNWFGEEEELPVEFRVVLPADASYPQEAISHFLTTLSLASCPVVLEIIGTTDEVAVQIVCRADDGEIVAQQLQAQFPEAKLAWRQDRLESVWNNDGVSERLALDFGLCREFMLPLDSGGRIDPFVSLIGGMAHLGENETAVYQVIFTPLVAPWRESTMAAVTRGDGKPFFDDGADLVKQASAKVARPLFGVVLRLAAKADGLSRSWDILRGMAPALRLFSRAGGQSLMPLSNEDYDDEAHCADVLWRRSRRCGMILNLDELVGLAHWPSAAVKCAKLTRVRRDSSRRAPAEAASESRSIFLGVNEHEGDESDVLLSPLQRLQHVHCIGPTGTGKSTLLLSMITQDLESGQGFALLDPHGDLIDKVLARIPTWRLDDVVLIDPSDEETVTPFNVLSAHSEYEKTLLASDLVSVFRQRSSSWGDRMGIIFQNLVLAFLEHRDGGTLADMRRFLVDADWREAFLEGVGDPDVQFYWQQTFPKLDGQKSVGPILTRLETLLTPKIIRYMVSQRENRIDFSKIMDEGRILLVRLPMGLIGNETAIMLGSLVMVKLQQMAMSRARMAAEDRTPFFCYVDECHHFVTSSMAEILAGARKYGLGMVLAHQYLHQLSQSGDVAAALMTNAATRIVFRVSESDGRALKGDFAHYEPKDFAELPNFHAICRIGRADLDFNLRITRPDDPDPDEADERRREAVEASRSRYTVSRKEVEKEIRRQMASEAERAKAKKTEKTKTATTREPKLRSPEVSAPIEGAPPVPLSATTGSTREHAPQTPIVSPPAGEAPPLPPSETEEPVANEELEAKEETPAMPRPVGLGRGGNDHQIIVGRVATEGSNRGYKVAKEATVGGGRVDVTLESRRRRIAVEVCVNSNTAHEIENLTKCIEAGFDFVVSVAPLANVRLNIERAATKAFNEVQLQRMKFISPDALTDWLEDLAYEDGENPSPQAEQVKIIGGRRVRLKHREISPDERRRVEAEQIEAIADLVDKNRGGQQPTASD